MHLKAKLLGVLLLAVVVGSVPSLRAAHVSPSSLPAAQYTFVSFEVPGSDMTHLEDINDFGQAVGFYRDSGNICHGFLRSPAGTITTVDYPGAVETILTGLNNAGDIVGVFGPNACGSYDRHPFLYSHGVFTALPDGPVMVLDINNAGQVVGGAGGAGFILENGVYTSLAGPGTSINDAGTICGHYNQSGFDEPYVLTGGVYTTTTVVSGSGATYCQAINELGDTAGVSYEAGGSPIYHGFVRSTDGTVTFIDYPGFNVAGSGIVDFDVFGLNSAGTIGGSYYDSNGVYHGFIATRPFVDDFDRPDGAVGNGWSTWGAGAAIEGGELATFGAGGQGGGVFRTLPVTFPVSFTFDLRNFDANGNWVIEFNDTDGQQNGYSPEFELYQQAGGLAYYYHTSSGPVGFFGVVVDGQFQNVAPAHVSGTVQADLSSSTVITYPDSSHVTVSTPAPMDAVIEPRGLVLALGNALSDHGPHYFDNVVIATGASIAPPPDTTPPDVTCASPDSAWHALNVSLACTASDEGSGLADAGDAAFTLSTGVADGTETDDAVTDARTVCDASDNCTTVGPISGNKIDRRPPTILTCASPDGAWHALNVSLSCSVADGGSGLVNAADAGFTLSTSVVDGAESATAATGSRTVCDNAGNCRTVGPIAGNQIDRRSPTITIGAPTASTFLLGQVVNSSYGCADAGSGVSSCSGPVASGSPIDTSTVGSHTFSVPATDAVGNTTTSTVTYVAAYGQCVLFDQTKAHKAGSTVPIKLQLCNAAGANVSDVSVPVVATAVHLVSTSAPGPLADSGNANPDNQFRFSAGSYIFNLSLKGFAQGTYALVFTAGNDPTVHTVQFQVK